MTEPDDTADIADIADVLSEALTRAGEDLRAERARDSRDWARSRYLSEDEDAN